MANANALAVGFRLDPLVWSFDSLNEKARKVQEKKKEAYEKNLSKAISERRSNLLFHTLRARKQTTDLDNMKVGDKNSDRPYTLPTAELFGYALGGLEADFKALDGQAFPETFTGIEAVHDLVPRGLLSFTVLSGAVFDDADTNAATTP